MSRPILVGDGAYAVALAELPLRTHRGAANAGSIVVIDGSAGWGSRLHAAVHDGAAAIVLAEPRSVAAGEFLDAGTAAVPVIVDRARLRHDVIGDASPSAEPGSVRVEGGAVTAELDAVLRDAIGWVRAFAGTELEPHEARVTDRAVLLHLSAGGVDGTVLLSRRESPAAWLRALSIGAERVQVSFVHPVGSPVVERTDARGVTQPPRRYESHERLSIRRALDALDSGDAPRDLADLAHDSRLASRVLR